MNTLKKCAVCNSDIAKNAVVCPSCGAKQKKPIYKKWWVWVIVVVVIGVIGGSGGSSDVSDKKGETNSAVTENANNKNTEEKKEVTYKIGDVITTDKFEIMIKDVKTRTSVGSEYVKSSPSEGGIYVVVDWSVKNISTEPVSSFSLPTIKLEDIDGVDYSSDVSASTYYTTEVNLDTKIISNLNPGITVNDAEVFEIAKQSYEEGGFSLKINADKDFVVPIN